MVYTIKLSSEKKCALLEQQYHSPIFKGDGTKKEIFEQVGLDNINVAIAATNDDNQNVIAALQVKRLGVSLDALSQL